MLDSTQKIRRILDSLSRISDSKSLISRLPFTGGCMTLCALSDYEVLLFDGVFTYCVYSV